MQFIDKEGNEIGSNKFRVYALYFDRSIEHERMQVFTYGHEIPEYNIYPMSGRGALISFSADLKVPVLEFYFPPVGHHEKAQKLKYSRS
jgi:hypothetical protein